MRAKPSSPATLMLNNFVSMSVNEDDAAFQKSIVPQPLPAKKRRKMNLMRAIARLVVRGRSSRKKTTRAMQLNVAQSGKDVPLQQTDMLENVHALRKTTVHPDMPRREIHLPPPSPCDSEGWFSSGGMSHYASAEDLQALDNCTEESEEESSGGVLYDIDLQAEMFIAKFYEQMKLQSMNL